MCVFVNEGEEGVEKEREKERKSEVVCDKNEMVDFDLIKSTDRAIKLEMLS